MLNGVKSAALTAWLSVMVKFCSHRRVYPMDTDIRGNTSCCTVTPMIQSDGRVPQPFRMAGSYDRLGGAFGTAKLRLLICPHSAFWSGFCRSQSGAKLLRRGSPAAFVSHPHDRVTLVGMRDEGS